jgi:hypothetical protein
MIPDKTISALENLVNNLSKEDCQKVYDNNNSVWRYKHPHERKGQYIYNILFEKVSAPFPELFYETDDKMSDEVYTTVLFEIINKLENE